MRKLFTLKYLLPLLFFGLLTIKSQAQIAAWNNSTLSGITSASLDATTNDANLKASVLSRGSGIVASSLSGGYASNNWIDANQAAAITNNRYYQCTISANANFKVSLTALDSKLRRTSSGPNAYIWRYSTDGTNFTDIGSAVSFTTTTTTGDVQAQISLSGISALQNVVSGNPITLRLYAWGGTAAGTLSIGTGSVNSLAISGDVTSAISSNADLSNLTLSAGSLSPAFATATTSYTSSVPNAVTSITITPTASDGSATITVNGTAVTSGSPSSSIPLNTGQNTITTVITASDLTTTKTYIVTITRAGASTPALTVTSPLPDFGNVCTGTVAGSNSFILDGNSLNGTNINIAALAGFSYSETSAGTYTSSLNFSYTGGAFTGKVIYVKFNPTVVQSYNGNIALNGGGASSNVVATATGVNSTPSLTTGTSSAVTANSGTVAGTIASTGCTPVTVYGIEYSTASGFPEGSGTQLPGSNLSAGNFSVNIAGLSPNTRYYYKAYATNSGGISYGPQQAFTCTPLPVPMAAQSGLSFTEDFSDIANWGSFFTVGDRANHWGGLSSNATAPGSGIPNGTTITAASTSFQGANFISSGGVQKGTDQLVPTTSMVFLSTGSPDNTTSTAIDFYLDFTGVNANTLSFDYETVNNSTGDRNGSLRVYATIDGVTFTELPNADVLNFTNNVSVSGSKTNVILPAIFNNSPTARLRFYYHNGSGGTGSGSRPKISIDNLKITAVATTPCVSPTAPATALVFGAIDDISIHGSFTGSSSADNYMVIMSTSNALTGNPVNGQIYNLGENVGDGTVIYTGSATSFTATGLSASTRYYFFIFPLNSVCTGGPLYYTTNVLESDAMTAAGLPACVAPAAQPTNLVFTSVGVNSIQGSFTATSSDGYLILRSTDAALTNGPVNGQAYNTSNVIGNATVVQSGNATTFSATGLSPNTQYYFFIFSLNSQSCVNGPVYDINLPLNGTKSTMPLPPCAAPGTQPGVLNLTSSNTAISGSFVPGIGADYYLIIRSLSPTLSASPVNSTDYNVGDNLGGGIVISNSSSNSFLTSNLTPLTTYYFYVFASNKNCSGGTKYLIVNPLTGNAATTNAPVNNYYFGTLHSHSDYSDGNQDHIAYTPADDYSYAMTANCMDYLGISEHNHFSTLKNPGNHLATYHLGSQQADAFTAANPNFLALYGMEWGVISGGGHVVIYGDKMDDLFGWESGSGGWGPTNNYDVYVPKSTYTGPAGLFKTINDYVGKNTFATLAHPNFTDYNNIAGTAYDLVADNAITGAAVESGPATSLNQTYSNPGSSLYYLPYFETLLSKGYHLGPTIDHDNHNTTFGHTTYSRTAIIAPALTKTEIVKAMRNMHFYATQDCDSKVDFTINTQIMGSIIIGRYAPSVSVMLSDVTTSTTSAKIRLMYGVPGSGSLPIAIDSTIGNTYSFTDNSLPNKTTAYYYVEITNGTARIITSPIWYTRDDADGALPVRLSAFAVQKVNKAVKLTWATEQEINSRSFIIERSADGVNWNAIETVNAAGNSNNRINYTAYDNSPFIGINYYRLKQVDIDGKIDFSPVKNVVFNSQYQVTVSPNPATDFVNVTLTKNDFHTVTIEMVDLTGKVVNRISTSQNLVQMKVNNLSKGTYFIKVIDGKGITTQKLVIQ